MESKPYSYSGVYAHETPLSRPPTDYKRFGHFTSYGWLLESLTLVMSAVCFAAIVALLVLMDGKPLSDWTTGVSFNAIIAILSTACGTLLMHGVGESISQHKWLYFKEEARRLDTFKKIDQASRGVSGSAKLVLGSRWNLATFGAMVSITRLAFSPLIQQVIQIENQLHSTASSEVSYGFTHEYNRPGIKKGGFLGNIRQDPQMQTAILQGVFNVSVPSVFSCPGLCSWDTPTVSLGFKTDCTDVTKETIDSESCDRPVEGSPSGSCIMNTPNDVTLFTTLSYTDAGTSYVLNSTVPVMNTTVGAMPANFSTFMQLAVYRAELDVNFAPTKPSVLQCSLSLTAYEYRVATANGSDFHFEDMREVDFGDDGMGWKAKDDGLVDVMYYTEASESKGLPAFSIPGRELKALQNYFTSSSIVSAWVAGNAETNQDLGLSAALEPYDVDIEERFNLMTTSMTDYLRSGPNRQLCEGRKQENVPFVTVRWYWLAGPAAIELGAVIFVLITMISNRASRQVPLWKSSVTAVLNCELDERNGMIHPRDGDIKALEERTKRTFVRLE